MPFINVNRQKIIPLEFAYRAIPQGTTDLVYESSGIVIGREAPAGYLVGLAAQLDAAIVTGTITIKPKLEGVDFSANDLDIVLTSTVQTLYKNISRSANFAVAEGEFVGAGFASTNPLDPNETLNLLITAFFLIYP